MLSQPYNIRLMLFILTMYIFGSKANASSGRYPIQNFSPSDYKAGIQNIDFAQNRNLSIFVANNLGVLSYDSNNWDVHAFKNGKKQRSLAFDEETNRLYVGSQGEIGYFEENWSYQELTSLIPSDARDLDEVWDVFIFESAVYFCTFRYIYKYDGERIRVISHENGFNRSFRAEDKLFTQTTNGILLEIQNGNLIEVRQEENQKQIVAGVVQHQDGHIIFYNSGQIAFTSSFNESPYFDLLTDALEGSYVNHVLELSDTRLAICTQQSGLFLFDLRNGQLEQITIKEGLLSNSCLRGFQDFDGNLWVGMQTGIAIIHINSPMRLMNRDINLAGSGYASFDTEAGTYFTTSNGVYFQGKNDTTSQFLQGTEGPAYEIQEVAGKIYACHHTGLFLLSGQKAVRVASLDGLWDIKQLRSSPAYVIGGTYRGLYLFKIGTSNELVPQFKIKGFNESSRFFEEDHLGGMYVSQYYKGLFHLAFQDNYKQVEVKIVSREQDKALIDQIILSKIDNDLFVATNNGVFKINQSNEKIETATLFSNVVGDQPVYLLKQDLEKNIHIIAENLVGFFKQVSSNNYVFVPSSLYQLKYFLNNDLLHASINIKEGLSFSANEGFLHYYPKLENRFGEEKPLGVSSLVSPTQDSSLYLRTPFSALPKEPIEITTKQSAKVLKFNINSFQYRAASHQQFRYQLKGFENEFGPWSTINSKEYTNLKGGEYEFIVQTRNSIGEIISSEPLMIHVKQPFLKSSIAKALYVALLTLALLFIIRIQKKRYEVKEQELVNRKKVELEAKQQKLIEIEKQKDKELSNLEEEKHENELRHLNTLLASSTMNLVVKNEFIETIKNHLGEIRKKGTNSETKKALEGIEKEIDTTLRVQEDWNQFKTHFDQVHRDFFIRLRSEFEDLTANDQKLCAFLRLNLSTKEIARLMSISHRGVEIARYRLRKKLGIQKGENLAKFILNY